MSTNINIDVTLQRLQEVANETTEKNREEKKAREEDLAIEEKAAELSGERDGSVPPIEDLVDSLGQPISRTGEPPSEKQKPNDADKSSVPDLYKKLDPGAGAVPLFRPVHGWITEEFIGDSTYIKTIYSADGSKSAQWTLEPPFSEASYFSDPWPPPEAIASNFSVGGTRSVRDNSSSGTVVLPLNDKLLVYAEFKRTFRRGARYYNPIVTPGVTGIPVSSTQEASNLITKCFLVGLDTLKEISMPTALLSQMDRIWPLPTISDIFLGYVTDLGSGSFKWLFLVDPFQETIADQNASPLYSHYLDWYNSLNRAGTPPIYWYLRNYNDFRNWREITPEAIRQIYSDAVYGRNIGKKWYYPVKYFDNAESGGLTGYAIAWFRQKAYDDFRNNLKQINNYGRFSRSRFADGEFANPIYAWDANASGYCRQQLLALGFTEKDLTP